MKTYNLLETRIKTKKNTSRIIIQSITMVKIINWIQHTKMNRSRKNNEKDGKALYKLMNNAMYKKTMENLTNKIDVRLVNNKKDYWTSKPSHMLHKIFDHNLVAICKSKVKWKLNKAPYTGMRILELSKVLMYEFHYNYIKNEYDNKSKLLFTDTDSLMYEIKTVDVHEDFSSNKEVVNFSNYLTKSKYYDWNE